MTQETQAQTISAVFAYAKIQEPAFKYQSTTEKEFSIDLIVDKATAKAFGKQFPKQKGKQVDNEDFEEIYKIPPPFPDQDEQYVLKLKRPAQYKDGKPLPETYWPKVMQKKSGKAVAIPRDVLVGNGSVGKVSYDVNENDYGTFAKLKNVLVEELKEYKKPGGTGADDFGLELEEPTADEFGAADDGDGGSVKVPVTAKTKAPAVKGKKPPVDDSEDENSDPF